MHNVHTALAMMVICAHVCSAHDTNSIPIIYVLRIRMLHRVPGITRRAQNTVIIKRRYHCTRARALCIALL